MNYEEIFEIEPYGLDGLKKRDLFCSYLKELTNHHQETCRPYSRFLEMMDYEDSKIEKPEDFPMVPVSMFKKLPLSSIAECDIFKIMTSSGTSGQEVSKIYLDAITAAHQQKTLSNIVAHFIGNKRMPMLIIDSPNVLKDRKMFSARGAGILGFSIFASRKVYALNENMELDLTNVIAFLDKYKNQPFLIFGFTYIIWKHFYQSLVASNQTLDLSQGFLIHGGGFKKLIQEAVAPSEFNRRLNEVCKINRISNYYGMVEQTGCIYMECEWGHLHASSYSDIVIRDMKDFRVCNYGEKGVVELLSLLPRSYPGHVILTEDEGIILGEDDCPCGRLGKYFHITGRIKEAEIRGCSDTYEG